MWPSVVIIKVLISYIPCMAYRYTTLAFLIENKLFSLQKIKKCVKTAQLPTTTTCPTSTGSHTEEPLFLLTLYQEDGPILRDRESFCHS